MAIEQLKRTAIPELAVVELLVDVPDHGLRAGERGTVVDVYNHGEAYEVEFIDNEGFTTALVTLPAAQLRMTWAPH